ncbi:hypothetical protein DESPIGER_1546 [Desulfovibrio piger]|uniref:Uncharacterized protein n=1 Tax=Desulfovibrio piger TaxID=901 RepID=A0A1K1LFB3_9BACT|nr:hypothetical protein DESPIGER_1546 [Desulfovibrio piger]
MRCRSTALVCKTVLVPCGTPVKGSGPRSHAASVRLSRQRPR